MTDSRQSRIYNRWPVAKEGLPFIAFGLGAFSLFSIVGLGILAALMGLLTLFTAFFFRDPERSYSPSPGTVLSPADGKLLDVRPVEARQNPLNESAFKISIFMSLFDVHVNRVPVGGRIEEVTHHRGNFFSANLDKASLLNEKNIITLSTASGQRVVWIQIAGLVARRIACWTRPGDQVVGGQRFGLIRFGSRLEVYLPMTAEITAKNGQKMRAGETVIGYLP